MSQRTAIEINHDYASSQSKNHTDFFDKLFWALYHGDDKDWEELGRLYGVEKVYRCHHGDDRLQAHKDQRDPANFVRTP